MTLSNWIIECLFPSQSSSIYYEELFYKPIYRGSSVFYIKSLLLTQLFMLYQITSFLFIYIHYLDFDIPSEWLV